jgi:hypothetical protein
MRTRPILSDEHEQTQKFNSEMSKEFAKRKQLEKEKKFFLRGDKDVALVFNP